MYRPSVRHIYASLIALAIVAPLSWGSVSTIRVGNPAPQFKDLAGKPVQPSDGGYENARPLNMGEKVIFTATAVDANGDDYYLAICKSDKIRSNRLSAPDCLDGTFGMSSLTSSGQLATVEYQVDDEAAYENEWYAFVCDYTDLGPACSSARQGVGENGSPFYVYKRVGTLRFGEDCPDLVALNKIKLDDNGLVSTKKAIKELEKTVSKRQIRKLVEKELSDQDDQIEEKDLEILEDEILQLKNEKSIDQISSEDESQLADALLEKKENLKKIVKNNVQFCVSLSNDDDIDNLIGKKDKKVTKKQIHEIDNDEMRLNFNRDKERSITLEFLQEEAKKSSAPTSTEGVNVKSKEDKSPLLTSEQVSDEAQPPTQSKDVFKTIVLKHQSIEPQEKAGLIDRLLGANEDPLEVIEEPLFDLNVVDETQKLTGTEKEVVYQAADNRKTDSYKYLNDPSAAFSHILKNYTLYHYGTGKEAELYTFENVALHQRADGIIEGYSIVLPDLNPEDVSAPSDLIERASRFLAKDQIETLHFQGGENPDFILRAPFVVDREGFVIDDIEYEIVGDSFNQIKIAFEVDPDLYPVVLDPTIEFTAPGTSNVADSITGLASSSFASSIAVGDLNNDGKNDIVIGSPNALASDGALYVFYENEGFSNSYSGADVVISGQTNSALGSSIEIVDADSDGDDDLVVTANNYSTGGAGGQGRAYIFYNDGSYPTTAASADVTITGDEATFFGESVKKADLDGDLDMDLLISAKNYNSSQGRAYIFYNDGSYPTTAASADVTITGESTGDEFGHRITIGDFDSDSDADIAISSPSYNGSQGRAYIFYNDGSYPTTAASADVTITGEALSNFGYGLVAGDFNADRTTDLAVGSPAYNAEQGKVAIFYNDGVYPATVGAADITILGESNSGLGFDLVSTDLNGDGRQDLVASGIIYADYTGRVYTFNNDGSYPANAASADSIISGEATLNAFGEAMSIGDINQDGFPDLLIGSNQYNTGQGRLYFFFAEGASIGPKEVLTGGGAGAGFTHGMASGDFNSDGSIDIAVGSPGSLTDDGEVYIFYNNGKSLSSGEPDVTIAGSVNNGAFGHAIASGDIDFDGDDDLLVSAPLTTNGTVYIFSNDGVYPSNSATADDAIDGGFADTQFGSRLAVGDIDFDGDDDIVASAPATDNGTVAIFYNDGLAYPDYDAADDLIDGPALESAFGASLAIGDIDFDGDDDLVIGAVGTANGNVYGFYNTGGLYPDAGSADINLSGVSAGSEFGVSVALGDIDLDQDEDILVGAPAAGNGSVYIFKNDGSYGLADDTISGAIVDSEFGSHLLVADIDGDNKNDLVVGAPGEPNGKTYIFYNSVSYSDAANADLTISGDSESDRLGSSSIVSDFNKDGVNDLFVAAGGYSLGAGRLYPFYGRSDQAWATKAPWRNNLNATAESGNEFQIESLSVESFGHVMTSGDFNGDGHKDLAVGAPDYNSAQGRVYIFYGDGHWPLDTSMADVVIEGSAGSQFGFALASNELSETSDHYDDLLVGAPGVSSEDGAVYLFNGISDWSSITSYSDANRTFNGLTSAAGAFGFSLSAEADLSDGVDGRVDFVVGSPYTTNGNVYIFYNDGSYSTSDVSLSGESAGDQFGSSIAIGELSSAPDARADLLIGAPGYSTETGRAYIYYNDGIYGAPDVTFTGAAIENSFGASVAVGAISGLPDARVDVIVGAPNTANGNVYLYHNDGTYGAPDVTLAGGSSGEKFGQKVAASDLSRDGHDDLVVSSTAHTTNRGYVQVFYNNDGISSANDSMSPASGTNYYYGDALLIDDFTQDGWNDLLVGAHGAYAGKGSIYLYDYGSLHLSGVAADQYGRSMATGDFDGDGDIDLAIGNPGNNTNAGQVLIFLQDLSSAKKATSLSADVVITGPASSQFGYALAAGDLSATSDVATDLVIGAPSLSSSDGAVYLFEGRSNWLVETYADADVTISGAPAVGAQFGYSLLAEADLSTTPDDRTDLVVGGPNTSDGNVYIFYNDGSYPANSSLADVTLTGNLNSRFGSALATGHLNADYRSDLVVGAPAHFSNNGLVNIFYNDGSYGSADLAISGESGSRLGSSMALADFDDDGDDDLVVGAPTYSFNNGRVYMFYNDGSYPSLAADAEKVIAGAFNVYLGQSVGGADFDGDGDDDLTVGAEGYQYFYFNDGSYPSACCTDYDLAYQDGNASYTYDSMLRQLASADLNQDGKKDLVISTPGYSSGAGQVNYYSGTNISCEAPTLSSIAIVDNEGFTGDETPVINLAYTGNGPVPSLASFSCDGGANWSVPLETTGASSPVSVDSFDFTNGATGCTADQGDKTIHARLQNTCGYSPGVVASDTTNYDNSGPIVVAYESSVSAPDAITITAVTTEDGGGAGGPYSYQFSGQGCTGSLPENAWTASGDADDIFASLSANTPYSFKVRARDSLGNEGGYTACDNPIYSSASIPGASIASGVTATTLDLNPVSGGAEKDLAIYIEAGASCDGLSGLGYIQANGSISASAVWQSDANWSTIEVSGLAQGTQYSFCSKARNNDNLETPFGSSTAITTNSTPVFEAGYPSDGGSGSGDPTAVEDLVSFSASVNDADGDMYWLLVCKNGNAPTVGNPPECDGGVENRWSRSALTNAAELATATYEALNLDAEANNWFGFVCDQYSCSSASQGPLNDNGNPFAVNHQSTFNNVLIGDTTGGTGSIEPGDTVYFHIPSAQMTDDDVVSSQDTINMYVCDSATTSFDYATNSCVNGTLICSDLNVDFAGGNNAECNDSLQSLAPVPTAHGSQSVFVYLEDNHSLGSDGLNQRGFEVADVAPTLISYIATDNPSPVAGGSDTVTFTARIQDINGENDIVSVEGYLFDDAAIDIVDGTCSLDDRNCYTQNSCTLNTAYGDESQVEAQCDVEFWFNGNASSNWEVRVNPTDDLGKVTSFSDSNVNLENAALSGVGVVGSIAYGNLSPGSTSSEKSVVVQNLGNTSIDLGISGTNLTSESGDSILNSQQKWSDNAGFDYEEGYELLETPESTGSETGCFDANMSVRTDAEIGTGLDELIHWLFKVPVDIVDGDYSGTNTISILTCD